MKTDDLLDLIGETDDRLIAAAHAVTKANRRLPRRLIAIAACVAVVAVTFSAAVYFGRRGGEVTGYRLPGTGGDYERWFYDKYDLKSSTVEGAWFEMLGADTVSEWCDRYDAAQKAGTADDDSPMLVQFIRDRQVPEETCRAVMDSIRENEEQFEGMTPTLWLTEEEIGVIYSGDTKRINETFASEYCIVANGEIFTPEWLLNHPVREYRRYGITYDQLKEKIDEKYAPLLANDKENAVLCEKYLCFYNTKLENLKK